jgi:hypothetical protein
MSRIRADTEVVVDDRDLRDALSQLDDDGNPHGGPPDDKNASCSNFHVTIPQTLGVCNAQQPHHQHA